MNFPHADLASVAPKPRKDHRAFLAHAIARQAGSATARALAKAVDNDTATPVPADQLMLARVTYFANQQVDLTSGSFLPATCINAARNDENGVYHSASANRKSSELNTTEPGNGSTFEISRTL